MNEEEKKAIDYFKNLDISFNTLLRIDLNGFENAINTLLNLIEKQQKEIEELGNRKAENYYHWQHLEAKIINKIEELEKKIYVVIPNEYNQLERINVFKNIGAIEVLKELLQDGQESDQEGGQEDE